MLGRDDRAIVRVRIERRPHPQTADRGDQPFAQRFGRVLSHRDDHRQGHAAFPGRTVSRTDDVRDGLIEIGVRQHDAMILGTAHRLHPLADGGAASIDLLGDIGRADKAHRLHVRMIQ